MKQINRSFAVVLLFAIILSCLSSSARAGGSIGIGKMGVPLRPVVTMPVGLNFSGVNMAIMPGDLVTLKNIMPEILVLSASVPTADKEDMATPDEVVTAEAKTPGVKVQAGDLPVGNKATPLVKSGSLLQQINVVVPESGDVNWDNSVKKQKLSETPVASIIEEEKAPLTAASRSSDLTEETQSQLLQAAHAPSALESEAKPMNGIVKLPKTGPDASVQTASLARRFFGTPRSRLIKVAIMAAAFPVGMLPSYFLGDVPSFGFLFASGLGALVGLLVIP